MPREQLALVLAWLGGAAAFAAVLISMLHGGSTDRLELLAIATWGAVALLIGIALRQPRSMLVKAMGYIWLLFGFGVYIWSRW